MAHDTHNKVSQGQEGHDFYHVSRSTHEHLVDGYICDHQANLQHPFNWSVFILRKRPCKSVRRYYRALASRRLCKVLSLNVQQVRAVHNLQDLATLLLALSLTEQIANAS